MRAARALSVQYAPVPVIPHRTHGPAVPTDWPTRYLQYLADHGTGWRAAKQAGVAYKTVQRLRDADPIFREHDDDARREHAEGLEQNLDRIAAGDDMPAVTANIVRLKKLDPVGYVERNLQITASFTAELPVEDGKALLHAMLGVTTPTPQLPERTESP
jgi:hypothetical protein